MEFAQRREVMTKSYGISDGQCYYLIKILLSVRPQPNPNSNGPTLAITLHRLIIEL